MFFASRFTFSCSLVDACTICINSDRCATSAGLGNIFLICSSLKHVSDDTLPASSSSVFFAAFLIASSTSDQSIGIPSSSLGLECPKDLVDLRLVLLERI